VARPAFLAYFTLYATFCLILAQLILNLKWCHRTGTSHAEVFHLAVAAAAAFLCLTASAQAGCTVPGNADAMQRELLSHLNAERKARGLPALALSAKLDKAAQGHACDNAKRGRSATPPRTAEP
jgi:uncharacterized protein YkwD